MSVFAKGRLAYGFCDRCGQRYDLHELRNEYDTGINRNNRVCPECWDVDHPQNFLFNVVTDDKIALRDPRPDNTLDQSRGEFGWDPVGGPVSMAARTKVGKVKILTP